MKCSNLVNSLPKGRDYSRLEGYVARYENSTRNFDKIFVQKNYQNLQN